MKEREQELARERSRRRAALMARTQQGDREACRELLDDIGQPIMNFLRRHYDGATILVAAGKWPCVMPELDIPFRKTLTETNRPYWLKLPSGPEKWVHWIIRGDGDAVDELMRAYPQAFRHFELVERDSFENEEAVSIYHLARSNGAR